MRGNDDVTRLYGAAIAVVSGGYGAWLAWTEPGSDLSWLMGLVGVVAVVHGVVLLAGYASRLGDASGLLMIGYAAVMLLTQFLAERSEPSPMDGMSGPGMGDTAGTMADSGMGALALLMLISGLIMYFRRDGR